jgi:hypothetical protein
MSIDQYLQKVKKIKKHFRSKRITIKYVEPSQAYFEYFFSVINEKGGDILIEAFSNDIKREGWHEFFNKEFWVEIINNNIEEINNNKRSRAQISFINAGFTEDFFQKEYLKYENGNLTNNCVTGKCYYCGVCDKDTKNVVSKVFDEFEIKKILENIKDERPGKKYLEKTDEENGFIVYFNKFSLMRSLNRTP